MTTYTIQSAVTISSSTLDLSVSSGALVTQANAALTAATTGNGLTSGDIAQVSLVGSGAYSKIVLSNGQFTTLPTNVTFANLWGSFAANTLTLSTTVA